MKYIKILTILLKLNFENVLVYRTNAVLIFFGSSLYNFGAVLFLSYLFTQIPLIGGWDKWDMILFFGVGELVYILYLFFTRLNILYFDKLMRTGNFDFYITKPINSMFYASIHNFSYENLLGVFQAMAIILYALNGKEFVVTFQSLTLALISGIFSFFIIHFLSILTIIPSLLNVQSRFYRLVSETSMLTKYPFEIFTNVFVKIFSLLSCLMPLSSTFHLDCSPITMPHFSFLCRLESLERLL